MKKVLFLALSLLTGMALAAETRTNSVPASADTDLPGSVVHSWLANSFSRQLGHHSVPVTAIAIAVAPDGTVFSAGVAEGYGGVASYKDGKFVTKYDYDSGFGSSAAAVAVDDTYVYIGTGVGLFRTRLGDETYNRTPVIGGGYVGTIRPDINGFKGSGGCVDSDNALNVTLRKNGE